MSIDRVFAESFFNALMSREPAQIARYVVDDAEWLIVGPIEVFPYCGSISARKRCSPRMPG
jgi:hypothetical protein